MTQGLPSYELGMNEAKAQQQFDSLQKKLIPLWKTIDHISQDEQTIVIVPSTSIDVYIPGPLLQAYEERFLFLLLLLRQPRARIIYVTSQPIAEDIVDYHLHLLPGVILSHAKKRLFMLSPSDGSSRPLSLKILERPRFIQQIRSHITNPDRAHLVPFMTTVLERDLSLKLGIPMYGSDPKFFHLGTKSGCRKLFAIQGVPHPAGVEDVRTTRDLIDAVISLRSQKPNLPKLIIKHDEGVGGMGNATLNLSKLPVPGSPEERQSIENILPEIKFELPEIKHDQYMKDLCKNGGVVEEWIQGKEYRSPSAQLRITPLGKVELLSTHDQVLGGPTGQTYIGARFPADKAYAVEIMQQAKKVGDYLGKEGVIGRFAIDFVSVKQSHGAWKSYAIELNLRKGGTTHPFLTLQFLTDGMYDAGAGVFRSAQGKEKCFIASDHVESPLYCAFTYEDVFDIIAREGLHFNQSQQKGVVLCMMTAIGEFGRFGLTAVGDTHEEADNLFQRTVSALDKAAARALNP